MVAASVAAAHGGPTGELCRHLLRRPLEELLDHLRTLGKMRTHFMAYQGNPFAANSYWEPCPRKHCAPRLLQTPGTHVSVYYKRPALTFPFATNGTSLLTKPPNPTHTGSLLPVDKVRSMKVRSPVVAFLLFGFNPAAVRSSGKRAKIYRESVYCKPPANHVCT